MNQNRTDLIGNLGETPELRFTKSGVAVCDLRVATNERYTDSQGNKQTRTDWHRVVVWGKQAEVCCEYLTKGREVRIEGKLRNNRTTDQLLCRVQLLRRMEGGWRGARGASGAEP